MRRKTTANPLDSHHEDSSQAAKPFRNICPDLSRVLTLRRGVKHLCNLCDEGFLLGVDGKHGLRRYTGAWKDVRVEHIEALGGVAIRKPCCNRTVLGSMFCCQHAGRVAKEQDQVEEEQDARKEAVVSRCRKGVQSTVP